MKTKLLQKTGFCGATATRCTPENCPLTGAGRAAGRPGRPWLLPFVPVPHPFDARQDRSLPPATVMAWTGKSRQTVARWAAGGGITDTACLRLCQHYAHGLAPIPPTATSKSARLWQQFRFAEVDTPHGRQWHLITPGGEGFNAAQVWGARQAAGAYFDACRLATRWQQEAAVLSLELARLVEAVGSAC